MDAWLTGIDIAVTLVLGVVGFYLANSLHRQTTARVAEKRFDSYAALWTKLQPASPMRRVTGQGPLTGSERRALFGELTEWYFCQGNGMLLGEDTRNIYLTAKKNLICDVDELEPESFRKKVRASEESDSVRGWTSIRQFSLLRTATRAEITIYTSPWGERLSQEDEDFLAACGVDLGREPWRSAARGLTGQRSDVPTRVTE
jgi:hypothetical protein